MTCERELSDGVIQWFCASYIDKVACGGTSQMFENWPLPSRPPSLCGEEVSRQCKQRRRKGTGGVCAGVSLAVGWKEREGIAVGARSSASCQGCLWVCGHLGWKSPSRWQCSCPSSQPEALLCSPSGSFYCWISMWKTLELQVSWWRGARAGTHGRGCPGQWA